LLKLHSSPDVSEKPAVSKTCFSWQKRATGGSSFYGLEKLFLKRGLVAFSWKLLL